MSKRVVVWDLRLVDKNGLPTVIPFSSYQIAADAVKAFGAEQCPEVVGPHYHLVPDEKGLGKP